MSANEREEFETKLKVNKKKFLTAQNEMTSKKETSPIDCE